MGADRLLLFLWIFEAIDDDNQGVRPRIPRVRLAAVLRENARVDLNALGQAIWDNSIWGEMSALVQLLRPNRRVLQSVVFDVTKLLLQRIPPWPTLRPLVISVASGRITADMFQRRTRRPASKR